MSTILVAHGLYTYMVFNLGNPLEDLNIPWYAHSTEPEICRSQTFPGRSWSVVCILSRLLRSADCIAGRRSSYKYSNSYGAMVGLSGSEFNLNLMRLRFNFNSATSDSSSTDVRLFRPPFHGHLDN